MFNVCSFKSWAHLDSSTNQSLSNAGHKSKAKGRALERCRWEAYKGGKSKSGIWSGCHQLIQDCLRRDVGGCSGFHILLAVVKKTVSIPIRLQLLQLWSTGTKSSGFGFCHFQDANQQMHGTSWDLSALFGSCSPPKQHWPWRKRSSPRPSRPRVDGFNGRHVWTANCVKWRAMYPFCDPHNSERFLDKPCQL